MDTPHRIDDDITRILYTREQIDAHIAEVGKQITADYEGRDLVVIAVLKGAAVYMSDLIRAIDLPLEIDFMAVSSYGSSTKSSGVVRIIKDLTVDIKGRDVLIAEDIIDSGITLKYLLKNLQSRNPNSLALSALFTKEGVQQTSIESNYPTLSVPNEFIVGSGLDYAERYRNLPYAGVLSPSVYSKRK